MFYIKPVKEELMYMNPRIAIYHEVVTPSELSVVRRLARPRVSITLLIYLHLNLMSV